MNSKHVFKLTLNFEDLISEASNMYMAAIYELLWIERIKVQTICKRQCEQLALQRRKYNANPHFPAVEFRNLRKSLILEIPCLN